MRPFYLLLKISLNIALRLFYKRFIILNKHKEFFGRTIYVSNHPNSFMDPILIGSIDRPIVFFMTRSDVFVWWLRPVLWAAHMLPIYRQQDGTDTRGKNNKVFNIVNRTIYRGNNILIFGEGFTDDTPIRGLKPVKKGAVRMGFTALEATGWKRTIYVAGMGVSYTDRNTIGSEFVLNHSDKICLNDYKEAYLNNPNKVINDLTKEVEKRMQECIVYVRDKENYNFFENVMKITRKGYNHENHDDSIPLKNRFIYSQNLASWFNENATPDKEELGQLKQDLEGYFSLEKRMKIQDRFVVAASNPNLVSTLPNYLYLFFGLPFALIGYVFGFVPYLLTKKITEKIMRRKVFWGSVKVMLAKIIGSIINIPIIIWITKSYLPHWSLGILMYFLIPIFWRISYAYTNQFVEIRLKNAMKKVDLSKFITKRAELAERIQRLIPVA